jgi:hypothetical protein
MSVVGGWGDRQHRADRLDPVRIPMRADEIHHHLDRRSNSIPVPGRRSGRNRALWENTFSYIFK